MQANAQAVLCVWQTSIMHDQAAASRCAGQVALLAQEIRRLTDWTYHII